MSVIEKKFTKLLIDIVPTEDNDFESFSTITACICVSNLTDTEIKYKIEQVHPAENHENKPEFTLLANDSAPFKVVIDHDRVENKTQDVKLVVEAYNPANEEEY